MNIGNTGAEQCVDRCRDRDRRVGPSQRCATPSTPFRRGPASRPHGRHQRPVVLTDADGDDIGINNFADISGTSTMTVTGLRADSTATTETTTVDATNNDTYRDRRGQLHLDQGVHRHVSAPARRTRLLHAPRPTRRPCIGRRHRPQLRRRVERRRSRCSTSPCSSQPVARPTSVPCRTGSTSTIANLTNISTSVQAAKSNIIDADFAARIDEPRPGQILSQACHRDAGAGQRVQAERAEFCCGADGNLTVVMTRSAALRGGSVPHQVISDVAAAVRVSVFRHWHVSNDLFAEQWPIA